MKLERTVLLATCALALDLMLGAGAANAQTVDFTGNTATGIRNLPCLEDVYDVTFLWAPGTEVYGPSGQGEFPFKSVPNGETRETQTFTMGVCIQEALNTAPVMINRVGPQDKANFSIAVGEDTGDAGGEIFFYGAFASAFYDNITDSTIKRPEDTWVPYDNFFLEIELFPKDGLGGQIDPIGFEYEGAPLGAVVLDQLNPVSWAQVTRASGAPPPDDASVGGNVTGLIGIGLVLQNISADDEPVTSDGAFTFDTPVAVGSSYSVTVRTQPSSPNQICRVSKGSGTVPAGGINNVAVSCVDEPSTPDTDGDGQSDTVDNCPDISNPGQENTDGDAFGDACDTSTFNDVPPTHWAYIQIEAVAAAGITTGCGGGNYCPDSPVSRAEMAVFLERAMRGSGYSPPPPQGIFNDVPTDYWAAAWIELLAADGISTGCGDGNFCPDDPIARDELAVFLERGINWPGAFSPAPATGTLFDDVPLGYWADAWIEQLANDGITGGCGGANYCPTRVVKRDELAVFLTTGFDL